MAVSEHLADTIFATMCRNNADSAELIALLNGSSSLVLLLAAMGALPSNVFRVDTSAVAADAAARVYPTADLAVAAAEATALTEYVLWMTEGQTHAAWTGAGFTGTKSISFACIADRAATVPVNLAGALPAPTGTQTVRFDRVAVELATNFDATGYLVGAQNSLVSSTMGGGALALITSLTTTVENCDFVDVKIKGSDALVTATCRRSDFSYTVDAVGIAIEASTGFSVVTMIDCSVRAVNATAGLFVLFGHTGGPETPVLLMRGGYVRVDASGGAGGIQIVTGGYFLADVSGTVFTRIPGGTVNWGKAGTSGQLSWFGTVPDDANLPTGAWFNNAGVINQA
jgi:hypothetical protein